MRTLGRLAILWLSAAVLVSVGVAGEADELRPTAKQPTTFRADQKAEHEALNAAVKALMSLPADRVTAHPAAVDFPGDVVGSFTRIGRTIAFPLNLPRWHSTGLYAAPGERVTVHVSDADAQRGLAVVIGCHTDDLTHLDKWVRFPRISRRFEIKSTQTVAANAFGGLIYIDIPRDKRLGGRHVDTYGGYGWLDETPDAVPGEVMVQIDGGVESPLYVEGKTTDAQWADMLKSGAPWGELASKRLILSARTTDLAKVAHPAELASFWDKVVDAEADLAGWPSQPAPPERIVFDRDISAGWMHSGYPIMAHQQSAHDLLSLDSLKTKGDWGAFHELGHNHEAQAATFGGDFVEVDVNFYSMWVMQTVVGIDKRAHPALKDVDKLIQQRLQSPPKIDPWTNLAIYIKTIDAFGWGPFKATLKTYADPGGGDGIKTREQKIDQWVLRYSEATGHDLSAYYAAFGLGCSAAAKEQLQSLPKWMPDHFPDR